MDFWILKKASSDSHKLTPTESASDLSVSEVANGLGITARWLNKLVDRGFFVRTKRGRLDLWSVIIGWARYQVELKAQELAPLTAGSAEEEVRRERARKLKLENDTHERTLIPMTEAMAAIDTVVGRMRTNIAAVPARVTDDVALRRRVETAIDAVLQKISDDLDRISAAVEAGGDAIEALEEIDT